MGEQNLDKPQKQQLNTPTIMRNIYFGLYAVSKLGMFYTIFQENWIGLIGFSIATGVSYIDIMKDL